MYFIECDGYSIYDPRVPDLIVTAAKLSLELNKADSLTFTIQRDHPNITALKKLKSTIVVYEDSTVLFRGRLLDETVGWLNEIKCVCEGAFAWLNDSIQRPFTFPISENQAAPSDYFSFLLGRHNEQEPNNRKITLGNCSVTDPNNYIARSDSQYSSTYTLLKEGLLDTLGGYFRMRYTSDSAILDYLSDFNVQVNQPISFGLNLLSLSTEKKGDSICTAILPLGKADEESGERLTISSLPNGQIIDDIYKSGDIVYSQGAETLYGGRIIKVMTFDDITQAENLRTRAKEALASQILVPQTVTLTAADLSKAGYSYNAFRLGAYVSIVDSAHSAYHSLLPMYLVSKMSLDLLNPASNKLTLGATVLSLVEGQQAALRKSIKVIQTDITAETTHRIRELEILNASALTQSETDIKSYVSQQTYSRGEIDQKMSEKSTEIQQTADSITATFVDYQADIDGEFETFEYLKSWIKAQGGALTFGRSDSEITLKIDNDEIVIYKRGEPVTNWNADKMLAPYDVEIPNGGQLQIGTYAFIPRDNGSLDFMFVG